MNHKPIASRPFLDTDGRYIDKPEAEGGCGVIGIACNEPIAGRHLLQALLQMHNRGNGKGGGIAAVGLSAKDLGVSQEILDSHYLLQVAVIDSTARPEFEAEFIEPYLEVCRAGPVPTLDDYREVKGLEIEPPDVMRYFVRVKKDVLGRFIENQKLYDMNPNRAEDEFIFQNSHRLNRRFYSALKEKRAFVLSHGRNIMILKILGFAEQVAQYYHLENFKAHGWIAHQRYPTKGRIWHPGGAHPFIGLDEALVHNGDFANYYSMSQYLKQFNIFPQFLTDTEVAVLVFDLWSRRFGYPLEYIIEALAPTSEYDFDQLTPEKQRVYKYIQSVHIPASPDGPWFFIIARNNPYEKSFQLMGITDTSMLRPQVFALSEGEVQIGLICSEKQAIDATLESLAQDDGRFCPVADKYWNARGGSATDGGAFIFTVKDSDRGDGSKELVCTNKFGEVVTTANHQRHFRPEIDLRESVDKENISWALDASLGVDTERLKTYCLNSMAGWNYASVSHLCHELVRLAQTNDEFKGSVVEVLTFLNDRKYATGQKKRASIIKIIRESLRSVLEVVPPLSQRADNLYAYLDWASRHELRAPIGNERTLVINTRNFPPEGNECDARYVVAAHKMGWRRFICYGYRGQRFTGCGLGPNTEGTRIDVYDSAGDYLASGIDGLEMHIHGNAQDQLGQIMKQGKLVIYGDVGQTFMYGAKGGKVYVLGNAAGRPLINAVGSPRVVINGTALDYLAESFMAGNPMQGGGFVILNGIELDEEGRVRELPTPYPGSNLFSLASGGAIYVRDPYRKLVDEQLNGGEFVKITEEDWQLIQPYLAENERLFDISLVRLLSMDGVKKDFRQVYRKIQPINTTTLATKASRPEELGYYRSCP
jgi:glutamate synthase domain-containing protein 1/glutamate synthase domain-containing protein 3